MTKRQQRARARAFLARVRRPFTPRARRWRIWGSGPFQMIKIDEELMVVTGVGPGYMDVLRAGADVPTRVVFKVTTEDGTTWVA